MVGALLALSVVPLVSGTLRLVEIVAVPPGIAGPVAS
jgi:hypothetical protein